VSGDTLQYRQVVTGITTGSAFRPWSRTGPDQAGPKFRCSRTGPGPFLAGPFDLYSGLFRSWFFFLHSSGLCRTFQDPWEPCTNQIMQFNL